MGRSNNPLHTDNLRYALYKILQTDQPFEFKLPTNTCQTCFISFVALLENGEDFHFSFTYDYPFWKLQFQHDEPRDIVRFNFKIATNCLMLRYLNVESGKTEQREMKDFNQLI